MKRKSKRLEDIANGSNDSLEFTERIIKFALGYGHIIVATYNQIHIYNEKYINTPFYRVEIQDWKGIMGERKIQKGKDSP